MLRMTVVCVLLAATFAVQAQTAPSPAEISAYKGLQRAAQNGNAGEILRLAEAGAALDERDAKGRTPAHVAAFASRGEALRALARLGADMNALEAQAYDIVTIAAVANDSGLMSLAIELGNNPRLITSPYRGTALIAAAHLGHVEVVRRLIAAGAPLDHVNNLGWTALMEAVVLGDGGRNYVQVVRLLLDAGADRSIADRHGVSPLAHARARGYSEIAEALEKGRG